MTRPLLATTVPARSRAGTPARFRESSIRSLKNNSRVDGARLQRGWHIDVGELGPSTHQESKRGRASQAGLLIDLNHGPEKESLKIKKLEKVRRGKGD